MAVLLSLENYKATVCAYGGWLLSAPFIFKYFINKNTLFKWMHYLPDSYQHRVQIWETFSNIALTRPFFGYGLGFRPLLNESEYGSPLCLFLWKRKRQYYAINHTARWDIIL
ncbi:MAG: hypothetical protein H6925_01810 [Holosporaceae bacterium]|nr:MAG: hypothetical protein H6925_01810 [Holosporaceae bacterium]